MKTIALIFLAAGLVFSPAHAQTALVGSFNNDLAPVQPAVPDSIVQITAEMQGLQAVAYGDLPPFGTYWEVMPGGGMAPLPAPLFDPSLPIYAMTDTIFLVDASNGQLAVNPRQTSMMAMSAISATTAAVQTQATAVANLIDRVQAASASLTMQSMATANSLSGPPGFGVNGGSYTPNGVTNSFSTPNYGTNLWIAQSSVAGGYLASTGSNTIADVQYEIQSKTNLMQTDWQSEGFIYGSELTNWTPLSVSQNGRINLFLRLKSWADDGSGLPIWWQLEYFGYVGVDPNANPKGDGWSNIQKFQNGMNPNTFYTPAAPQGLTAAYNPNNTASVNWQSAPGQVTGYTVQRDYYATIGSSGDQSQTFTVPASTTSLLDSTAFTQPKDLANFGQSVVVSYQIQAHYSGGDSPWSGKVWLEPALSDGTTLGTADIGLVAGPQGSAFLTAKNLPAGTTALRLTRVYAMTTNYDASLDIPISTSTNGLYPIPAAWETGPLPYGQPYYAWFGQPVNANGQGTAQAMQLVYSGGFPLSGSSFIVPPYFDGRAQLKQNLRFLLRSATEDSPFVFAIPESWGSETVTNPANYAYAGFFSLNAFPTASDMFDPLLPFEDNYFYRNFVFSLADVDDSGNMTTWQTGSPTYQFAMPSSNGETIPSLLATNNSRWLAYSTDIDEMGVSWFLDQNSNFFYEMTNGVRNLFGLPLLSAEIVWGNTSGTTANLSAGGTVENVDGTFYPETAQPQFQTVEYDFWSVDRFGDETYAIIDALPGSSNFTPTNTSRLMFSGVGSAIDIAGYAKLSLRNGYSGVYGYLAQYFDAAYEMTNGTVSTKPTGVLSPYGQFFATEPGPAALVTMPDVDSGLRGVCPVYVVGIIPDRNQGSNMDLSFNGADATSAANPMPLWCNNNTDRGHTVDDTDFEQDDLGAAEIAKLPQYQQVPDSRYVSNGVPAIPCTRDLEDYFRFWTPGLAAAMQAMPKSYAVRLSLTGTGGIRIFHAYESNGGTNYLFDETTASNQVVNCLALGVGVLTANNFIYLPIQTNLNEHFIFCGTQTGTAQVDLQILDDNLNVIADTAMYLQINDIKQMYERWTVGDTPTTVPLTNAKLATEDISTPAFHYTQPQSTNTPYILLVHGWNMERWEKDRFAETAYKRLYWQGYQGRFGSFRWPTDFDFGGFFSGAANQPWNDPRNFDNSESNAWGSATGLLNKLKDLNAVYPGHVHVMAHSMGNVVVGEALRQAGNNQVVNTYIAMQGAVAAHAYDATATTRSLGLLDSATPNCYANYWTNGAPCYFANSAGAGTYVNFFNANDWALNGSHWQLNQDLKPDDGYSPFIPNFYFSRGDGTRLNFPANTYEIFAYCDEARCYAIGAQVNVSGVFKKGAVYQQVDLGQSPFNFVDTHKYHSGQFRSDNMSRTAFWNMVLTKMQLK